MLTDLLIKALRPVLLPLILEALEQHGRIYPTPPCPLLHTEGPMPMPIRRSPMQGSP